MGSTFEVIDGLGRIKDFTDQTEAVTYAAQRRRSLSTWATVWRIHQGLRSVVA